MDRTLIHGNDRGFLDEFLNPATDYIIARTSGSTGTPKEIHLAKKDLVRSARATIQFFGLDRGSCLVSPLSADYIAGKMMIVRGLIARASTWMLEPHRRGLLDSLPPEIGRIDLLPLVPAQIAGFAESPRRSIVRNVIVGGAQVTPAQEQLLEATGASAWATYGMTETCSHVALRRIGGGNDIYEAMPGVRFDIDSRGCLTVDGLVTNDLVRLIDERHFRWQGRIDNVINSGGIKLHPELIERQLSTILKDIEFYLTSRPSELWGQEMVMVVTGAPTEGIMEKCREVLPATHLPKGIIFDPAPRYSTGGKLLRRRF